MGKLFVFMVLCCASTIMADFDWPEIPEYHRTSLGDNIDVATMKVLKAAYESAEDKNVVTSPLGLMILLSLYNLGTGPANAEISSFLGGTDARQISQSFKELSEQLSRQDPTLLTLANRVDVSNRYSLDDAFVAAAREYRSEIGTLDFSKPAEAAEIINKWSANKTHGHITEPVSKDALDPDVAAALFNVIYFNGHWHVPFKAEETKDKDFHVSRENVVKKPMMHLLQSLYYAESDQLKAKLIELPYKEHGFRMVVVLPNEVDGLPSVLQQAAEKGLLTDVFNLRPAGADVDLDIPKFDIRSKLDFNVILPKIGVSKLFTAPTEGIVKNVPVKVGKAFQEAFIKVNEEGATAGAFTGIIAVPMSLNSGPPPRIKFTVDHPFLYTILHDDKIIFAGTYSA